MKSWSKALMMKVREVVRVWILYFEKELKV